ncbi:hypothetical protein C8R45DRAFT_201243 [Mycena sanguinolenta]|nr:hypothetical protein C8R45DRAFT_201243 [Mycena sanguinolenta]
MSSGHKSREGGNKYYFGGGRGGSGGQSRNGSGGAGGQGMGASLSLDIQTRQLNLNNNLHIDNRNENSSDTAANRHPTAVDRPYIQQNIHNHGNRGIDVLHRVVALEAIHDSAESCPQPRCHPETRTKILQDLRDWVLDPHPQNTILWFNGPAGAGKSAIMQTLAGELRDAGRLGGSFFFKRGHATRGNGKTLFSTIAYQLALSVPWLRTSISQIVEDDPSVVARSLETQMRKLISKPSRSHQNRDPVAILIDGLDECEGHSIQEDILRAIRKSSKHAIPLRFIVASRPEPHIRETFHSPSYSGRYRSLNVEQSFHDVRKYLRDGFSRIHRGHHTMKKVPSPWPAVDILENLVKRSSGYFIYAATIIKFIDDKNYRPTQRLAVVHDGNKAASGSAFDALDQLYMAILGSTPRQAELIPILCAIANFDLTVAEIDQLFELPDGETQLVLRGLHSVLQVPSDDKGVVQSHHASLWDFLDNRSRSHNFYVGALDYRLEVARGFLSLYARGYRKKWFDPPRPRSPRNHLISFIVSWPPSVQLCPHIARMNPDYIFDLSGLERMVTWLKVRFDAFDKISSDPQSEITLCSGRLGRTMGGLCIYVLIRSWLLFCEADSLAQFRTLSSSRGIGRDVSQLQAPKCPPHTGYHMERAQRYRLPCSPKHRQQ